MAKMTYVLAGSMSEFLAYMETQTGDDADYKFVDSLSVLVEIVDAGKKFNAVRFGSWHTSKLVYKFEQIDMDLNS